MVYIQTTLTDTSRKSDDITLSDVNSTTQKPRIVDLGGLVHKTTTDNQKKTMLDITNSLSQAGLSALIRTGISIQQIERGYRGKTASTGPKVSPEFMSEPQAGIIERAIPSHKKEELLEAKIPYGKPDTTGENSAWEIVGLIKAAQEAATESKSEPDFSEAELALDQALEG